MENIKYQIIALLFSAKAFTPTDLNNNNNH